MIKQPKKYEEMVNPQARPRYTGIASSSAPRTLNSSMKPKSV